MKILNAEQIKNCERNAVENGIFSYCDLMYQAGNAAADMIHKRYNADGKRIAVVCGSGNNGGDGFVAAKRLYEYGAAVTVVLPFGKPKTDSAIFYYDRLSSIDITDSMPDKSDIIVDAVFGTGLNRDIGDDMMRLFKEINAADAVRISLDLPSGTACDSGRVYGCAVNADMTVTFIALKPSLLLPPASDYCGEIAVADIGLRTDEYTYLTVEKPIFPKRRRNSHKGTYGTALLICGSYGMAGAAILSTRAAIRSGVGIAKTVVCDKIYSAFTAAVPEAVTVPVKSSEDGTLRTDEKITAALTGCRAVLIGCGLGNTAATRQLVKNTVLTSNVPIVVDADGINAICGSIDIIKRAQAPVILTPHPGEIARLCNVTTAEIEADRPGYAKNFAAENGCILVLKGANTIIALPDGEILFNTTGNPGMATGGSGDVLSGIIVSLLAQGYSPEEATASAVNLHGLAGDRAAARLSEAGMIPSDIIEELCRLF